MIRASSAATCIAGFMLSLPGVDVPTLKIFFAALISRSWCVPHSGQIHFLMLSGISSALYPHEEQVFDDASHLSICTNFFPYLAQSHESLDTKEVNERSLIFLPQTFCIAFMLSVSRHITSYSDTIRIAVFH